MPDQNPDVQCLREDLLVALQAAEAVVPGNSVKKILSNLYFEVRDDHLVIAATDQQINLRALVRRVEVTNPGTVLIPARQLVSIVRESRSPDVRIAVREVQETRRLDIVLQDGQYHLPVYTSDEFPAIGGYPDQATAIPVPAERLDRMIRCTTFAVDKDRSSAVLAGVYCAIQDGELVMTATDGKVLCEARHREATYDSLGELTVVIPAQTMQHLDRLLGGNHGEVLMAVDRGLIFIRAVLSGGEEGVPIQVELTSRLVEGVYPSYRNAIPSQAESAVSFVTEELATAVRRTALMTSSSNRGIVMALEHDRATLSNFSQSTGTANIPVACSYTGPQQCLGMNAGNMQEILKVYGRKEITLELNGRGRGIIMRDDHETFLIMPITLPD